MGVVLFVINYKFFHPLNLRLQVKKSSDEKNCINILLPKNSNCDSGVNGDYRTDE